MSDITYAALCWLRFEKGCDIVCTEIGGHYLMDACGIKLGWNGLPESVIEIEIKTSSSDLRRDFEAKEKKHSWYASGKNCPNFMYFLVPPNLADYAKEYLPTKNKRYGLLVFDRARFEESNPWSNATSISSALKCRSLTSEVPEPSYLRRAIRRLQNEYFMQRHVISNHLTNIHSDISSLCKGMESRMPILQECVGSD